MKLFNIMCLLLYSTWLLSSCDIRDYRPIESKKGGEKTIINEDSLNEIKEISIAKWENIKDTAVVTHFAEIKTSMGIFTIGLFGEDAPETVANLIGLSKLNYYNGLLFHRVARNFLIQTGDKSTLYLNDKKDWGFGGESFYGGEIEDELNPNTISYKRGYEYGTVAMANKGANTNTSQFFICLDEAKKLERKWTIFGKVIDGMDIVEQISRVPVEPSERGKNDGIPLKPIRIYSVSIKLIKAPNLK